MKQTISIEIEMEVERYDFYTAEGRAVCLRCVLYEVCGAIQRMDEFIPNSFIITSALPCRQHVDGNDRKYFRFSTK